MDAQGNAAAIWLESPSGIRIVTSAFFSTATSKWSTPNYISNGTSAAQDPTISVSPQGDIFVVWTETSAPVTTLYGRSYRQNGWSSIYTIASGTLGPRGSVGLDGYGRAIIAWSQFDSFFSRNDIYATYYENQNFSSPQILSNLGSGSATVPRIAVNPMGYGWVLWEFFVTSVGEFVQGASSINPVNFFGGEQIFNQTSFQSSYNNTLFWSASPSPTTGYKIYRNGELLSELPLLSREYVDPAQNKKASTIYSITTVTPLQKESEAVSVTLP
jgi:hypothetical protein